ncbi:MAG TPA: hypothetical protein PKE26_14825 [Kiritimatiellia bacterium]|nr:hypothetical protein [Kiritimatiellia bacterium]HMP00373.1 hypothetical protein [Kiritimatiellia bacterium]
MPVFRSTFALLAAAFLQTSCMHPRTPPVRLCGGVVRSAADYDLEDVRVVHLPSGRAIAINHLLAGRDFELGFAEREIESDRAAFTWLDPRHGPRECMVELPRESQVDVSQRLIYTITPEGVVTVDLTPCP